MKARTLLSMLPLALGLVEGAGSTQDLAAQTVAIRNGTVHTVSGAVIPSGTVLIQDGRITAVGANVQVPSGARVIDATGKVVTPGLLDSSSWLGLIEIGAEQNTVDRSTSLTHMTAAFSVADGINPLSTLIPITRVEGITRAVVVPGNGSSLLAGQGALIDLYGDRLDDIMITTPVAMYGVLGEEGAQFAGGARGAAMLQLRSSLMDAQAFGANPSEFDDDEGLSGLGRLDLMALAPVASGEVPLVLQVHRASDILAALRIKEEFGLTLILSGVLEGWMVAADLAAAQVPVIANALTNLPTFQSLGATYENIARMHAAGVTVVMASYHAHNARNLKQAAGMAVSYGMPHDAALASVTSVPAQVWGIADDYGTLEAGKAADVVVWSGDPFELTTYAEHVFIDGVEVPQETRQRALARKYRSLDRLPPWR